MKTLSAILLLASSTGTLACELVRPGASYKINTPEAAIAAAKAAWLKGKMKLTPEYIAKYEPYKAVRERESWHVYGSLDPGTVGGTPEATVCPSDGNTEVWHGQ